MNEMIPIKSKPLFLQVEEFIRGKLASGAYEAHGRLPSARELADITGTSYCTVQTTLAKLCREGLLESRIGRGTYVNSDKSKLTCAGFYLRRPLSRKDSRFYQVLIQELRHRLNEAGVTVRVWADERDEEKFPGPPDSLFKAMEKREIQGLIGPLVSGPDLDWLENTPIPAAYLGGGKTKKNGIKSGYQEMVHLGLEELHRQGCRSVGTISSMLLHADDPDSIEQDYYRSFASIAGDFGMKIRNDWMRYPAEYTPNFSQIGYDQFHALWDLPERPEGLMVFPDEVVTGVITAILERRVCVPQDLKVAFHLNDLLPYVCPFEAIYLRTDIGGVADSLIKIVQDQCAGKEVGPVQMPISLIIGGRHAPTSARQTI